jgi:glycosyltransferase involved in cell wall biosynthesis
MTREGVEVHAIGGRGGLLGAALRLRKVLGPRWPIVCAYGFKAGLATRFAAARRIPPAVVIGVRGLHFTEAEDPGGIKTRVVLGIERLLEPRVARYDANSTGARDFLVTNGFPANKMTVIHNGVQFEGVSVVHHGPRDRPRAICVARFVPRKRHDVLLRAAAALRDRGVALELELVGYGPIEPEMKRLTAELGLDAQVVFTGRLRQSAITSRLLEADLFVLTSLWEGMPGSVLEAMAAGLPVVATDASGTNEVVIPGETGLLVPPGDVEATADALARLAGDPGLRRRMGEGGRRRVEEHFSFERVVHEKIALYRSLTDVDEITSGTPAVGAGP